MITSSKDIFEQVAEAVQSELDGIEGHIGKTKKGASSKAVRSVFLFVLLWKIVPMGFKKLVVEAKY